MARTTPEARQAVQELMNLPQNSLCADCKKRPTKWASSTLGVFICLECSGIHRSLGTHITFVRSCTLDGWTPEQARVMRRVGNSEGNAYWEARLPPNYTPPYFERAQMEQFIRAKYAQRLWIGSGEPPHLRNSIVTYAPGDGRANPGMYEGRFSNAQQPAVPVFGRHFPTSRSTEPLKHSPPAGLPLTDFMNRVAKPPADESLLGQDEAEDGAEFVEEAEPQPQKPPKSGKVKSGKPPAGIQVTVGKSQADDLGNGEFELSQGGSELGEGGSPPKAGKVKSGKPPGGLSVTEFANRIGKSQADESTNPEVEGLVVESEPSQEVLDFANEVEPQPQKPPKFGKGKSAKPPGGIPLTDFMNRVAKPQADDLPNGESEQSQEVFDFANDSEPQPPKPGKVKSGKPPGGLPLTDFTNRVGKPQADDLPNADSEQLPEVLDFANDSEPAKPSKFGKAKSGKPPSGLPLTDFMTLITKPQADDLPNADSEQPQEIFDFPKDSEPQPPNFGKIQSAKPPSGLALDDFMGSVSRSPPEVTELDTPPPKAPPSPRSPARRVEVATFGSTAADILRRGSSRQPTGKKKGLFGQAKPRGVAGFRREMEQQTPGASALDQILAFVHDGGFRPVSAPVGQTNFGFLDERNPSGE